MLPAGGAGDNKEAKNPRYESLRQIALLQDRHNHILEQL